MSALHAQLREFGFAEHAAALETTRTIGDRLVALKEAIAGIEGYQLAVKRHSRALRHTAADLEREQLAFVLGSLRWQLERLTTRGAA